MINKKTANPGGKLRVIMLVFCVAAAIGAEALVVRAFQQQRGRMLVQYGSHLLRKEETAPRAEAVSSVAVKLNPYDGYAWFNYGAALYTQQKFQEALEVLTHGITYLPHAFNSVRLIAFSYYELRDFPKAAENFNRYLEVLPNPPVTPELVYNRAGLANLRINRLADATYYLQQATPLEQQKRDTLRARIMAAVFSNNLGAAQYCTRLFRFYLPKDELNSIELVANAINTHKLPATIEYLKSILPENAQDMSVVKALAAAYMRTGKATEAEGLIATAVSSSPKDAALRLAYGDILFAQKRYGDAMAQYDQHLRLEPTSRYRQEIEQKRATATQK